MQFYYYVVDKKRLDQEITKITSKMELEKREFREAKIEAESKKKEIESKLEKLLKEKSKKLL